MKDLKKCPFCKAPLEVAMRSELGGIFIGVCDDCGIELKLSVERNLEYYKQRAEAAEAKFTKIVNYCEPHLEKMWAATIVGIIKDCDFRDAIQD